jgi:DNA repair protein NreA
MQIQRVKYKDIEEIPRLQVNKNFKKDFSGSSPAPFIGRHNYPNVNIGFLSPQFSGETSHYDSPQLWSKGNFKIGTIASMRYGLVNSRTQGNIKSIHKGGRLLEIIQEVGMAKRGVELEVSLNKQPALNFKSEKEVMPFGPQGKINKARITANTKVDSRVERVVYDTDLKAAPALLSLYKKGFEESALNKILSVGNLGIKRNRILVPTRWSITAVDDTVGKQLIKEVKDLQTGEYQLYFGGGWGNYYLVLFYPEVWSYELFETYLNKNINPWSKEGYAYSTDYENYAGRKTYAEECAGGYYAARLPILEKMKDRKRQQSALVLRFISQEYNVPLGVWVCREASRKSLSEKPIHFSSEELMLKYAKELIKRKFGFDLNLLLKESKLMKNKKEQKKLFEFN